MHDMRAIREAPAVFDSGLKSRGLEPQSGALLALDDARRAAIAELEAVQARRNAASKEIGQAMAAKDAARAEALKAEVAALKDKMTALEAAAKEAEVALKTALDQIPNIPLPDVPHGADEHGNVEYRRHGAKPDMAARGLNGPAKQHFDLGEALGMMDFEAAARLSGARFVVLKQQLARLERALGQFMLDLHVTEHGYTEINPPLMVRDEVMYGTAQLPKFRDDQFETFVSPESVPSDIYETAQANLIGDPSFLDEPSHADILNEITRLVQERRAPSRRWLIPTAEVPLTNLVRDSILAEEDLPLRFTALTPSFRAEAGSAGRDTRGMLRQHQFMKVELVSITTPEAAIDEHHRMLACAENVLKRLDLHYRVLTLCTGDMGFASAKTYDIEVWMPGQDTYREISSCSVCGDFQARRMDARFRPRGEKGTRFVHTLNGSGIAVGRALIAVMENYQNGDGTITVPEVLRPYMGGLTTIGAK